MASGPLVLRLDGQQNTHQIFLRFFYVNMIYLAICYHLAVKKTLYIFALKFYHFAIKYRDFILRDQYSPKMAKAIVLLKEEQHGIV